MARGYSAVLSDLGDIRWSLPNGIQVAYIGWTNRGNLGDEAMYAAMRSRSPVPMRRAPLHEVGRHLGALGRARVLLVGGGTLLGRPEWTRRALAARRLLRPEKTVVLGAGLEPLVFGSARGTTRHDAMLDAVDFLRSCDYIGVRGPRTQLELRALGVGSEIVGDPALLLLRRGAREVPKQKLIAINLANVRDGYDGDRERVNGAVIGAARILKDSGYNVAFFAMERSDETQLRGVPDMRFPIIPWRNNLSRLISLLEAADAVLSERLHGGILSAARGVPFVQIGYKPKVYDFAESVGAESSIVSPCEVDASTLASAVIEAARNGQAEELRANISNMSRRIEMRLRKVTTS